MTAIVSTVCSAFAYLGGMTGALVGSLIPFVGSVVGGYIGSIVGGLCGNFVIYYTRRFINWLRMGGENPTADNYIQFVIIRVSCHYDMSDIEKEYFVDQVINMRIQIIKCLNKSPVLEGTIPNTWIKVLKRYMKPTIVYILALRDTNQPFPRKKAGPLQNITERIVKMNIEVIDTITSDRFNPITATTRSMQEPGVMNTIYQVIAMDPMFQFLRLSYCGMFKLIRYIDKVESKK